MRIGPPSPSMLFRLNMEPKIPNVCFMRSLTRENACTNACGSETAGRFFVVHWTPKILRFPESAAGRGTSMVSASFERIMLDYCGFTVNVFGKNRRNFKWFIFNGNSIDCSNIVTGK